MNRDIKLIALFNGYKIEPQSYTLSFSLDPESKKKFNYLKLYARKNKTNLSNLFSDFVADIQAAKYHSYTILSKNDLSLKEKEYTHNQYTYTTVSLSKETHTKVKNMCFNMQVSRSSLYRYFLNQLYNDVFK